MDTEMHKAFLGVYTSSKEILRNEQRHLYCNMLDLLSSTCKTTSAVLSAASSATISDRIDKDDLVHFWLADILPLMFDKERAIQSSAIGAFEQGLLSSLGGGCNRVPSWHASRHWPVLRVAITTAHAPSIHKLREQQNPHWHRVWCLLVRCLDREILKGASTINAFLAIVELGFRSADNQVRIESYSCWRLLIQIFHANEELTSPKRIKLICIPLKSSQSKTAHAATVKLRVWWYLITCLSDEKVPSPHKKLQQPRLLHHFESVVEPFLNFCFGASSSGVGVVARSGVTGSAQQYGAVLELALPCLALLLADERSAAVTYLQRECSLEPLSFPSTASSSAPAALLTPAFLRDNWRPLAQATLEAIRLLLAGAGPSSVPPPENEQQLLQLLLAPLLRSMLRLDLAPFSIFIFEEITRLLPDYPRPVVYVLNTMAAEGILLTAATDAEASAGFMSVLGALLQLFTAARAFVPPSILLRCIEQVFSLERFQRWPTLCAAMELVLRTRDDDDYEAFETKLGVWRRVSLALADYLRDHSLDYRLKERASVINRWLLWPLQLCVAFVVGTRRSSSGSSFFDAAFCASWRQLLAAGQMAPDRHIFLTEVGQTLRELLAARREEQHFPAIFDAYAATVLKLSSGGSCDAATAVASQRDLLTLLAENTAQFLPPKALEACLNTLRNVISDLKPHQIGAHFDVLKEMLTWVVRVALKGGRVETSYFEEWKRAILEKLRTHSNKCYLSQAKELFKGNDVFVIIPSVWSLNPDKLTDRQKERLAEKAEIPALYNDMSQSQESSIKPWTPKKIVIAKDNQSEIVLEGGNTDIENNTMKDKSDKDSTNVMTEVKTIPNLERSSIKNKKKPGSSKKIVTDTKKKDTDDVDLLQKLALHITADDSDAVVMDSENIIKPTESSVAKRTRKSCMNNKLRSSTTVKTIDTEKNKSPPIERSPVKENIILSHPVYQTTKNTSINMIEDDITTKKDQAPQVIPSGKPLCDQDTQLNTQTEITSRLDTSIYNFECENESVPIEKPMEIVDVAPESSCQNNQIVECVKKSDFQMEGGPAIMSTEVSNHTVVTPEICHPKEVSPKKTISKCMSLSSPPDRKLTNNSSSPTLRPKPSAHLTGRGAQLINMIRNKKIETVIQCTPGFAASSSSKSFVNTSKCERAESTTTASDMLDLIVTEHTSTPIQSKDLLIFSKRLPSPTASPTASILKRKMRRDSIEDISIDSPAFKRKRVSFHDPPVSVTKEYVRDLDESKSKPKRCLIPEKSNLMYGSEVKHMLKRRSKLDSMIEIEKYSTEHSDKSVTETNATSLASAATSNYRGNISVSNTTTTTTTEHGEALTVTSSLNSLIEQYPFEEILDKYSATAETFPPKSANALAKFVSNCMHANVKIKANVLETLSENHSKDFLDHAVQENLSSVVCDRLNPNSVIDYICAKSKINTLCRNNLLSQIPELLKNSKQESERMNFLKNVLKVSSLNDDNILELITLLVQMRTIDNGQSVSESAADSSSAL